MLQESKDIFLKNSKHAQDLLKLSSKEGESDPYFIKDFDLSTTNKINSYLIESFLRIKVQEILTDKWKAPTKGN